jgi:hypothetical protein
MECRGEGRREIQEEEVQDKTAEELRLEEPLVFPLLTLHLKTPVPSFSVRFPLGL